MRFFKFLHPDKSPLNARMPKRKKAKNIQKEQPTHTPHPHHEKAPRSFAKTTIAHSKFRMCIDAKFPHTPIYTPKFRNVPKSKVSDYLKRPSKFPFTHEVRGGSDYPTTQHTPTKHHPRSHSGFLIASKIPTFQGEILHLGGLD